MDERRYIKYTFILIVVTTIIRIYLASITGLGVDEAHYVQYALKSALSYYDHPPLVGYLIRFFIVIIGKSILSVRMPAIIAGVGTTLLLFLIGKKLYGVQAGFWSVVIFNCIPLFSAIGGITIVPETILCLFYLALLFLIWQIHQTENGHLWYFTGIITGLALLTKYTAFLLYPSILLFILLVPSMRRWLKKKEIYIGFLISIIMFVPVVIWNYENQWASFIFQLGHGLGEKKLFKPEIFLRNIGAQAGVFSPFIFLFLLYILIYTFKQSVKKDERTTLFLSFSLPVLLLFGYSGISNEVLPHWPAAGYLLLLPVLGNFIRCPVKKKIKHLFIFSLIVGILLTILIPLQIHLRIFPLSSETDISQDITGWEQLAQRIKEIKIEEKDKDFFIFTHKFYIASQLAYYLEPEIPVYCLSKRIDQYDFWQYPENLKLSLSKRNGLFFCDDNFKTEPEKFYVFREIEEPEVLPIYHRKNYVKNFYIYRCYNFDIERTDPSFLQSLNFTPKCFREEIRKWNERCFFLINRYACKNKFLDVFSLLLTWLGSSYTLIPIVLLIVFFKKRKQAGKYLAIFFLSLIIGGIIVHILKETLNIPRPLGHFGNDYVNVLGPPLKKGSFPSGHSQTVFTGVLLLSYLIPGWSVLFWFIGILSGISRCFAGAHFPLDIAGGLVIAVISFFIARVLFEKRIVLKKFYIKNRQEIKKALYIILFLSALFLSIPYHKGPVYPDTQEIVKDIKVIKSFAVKVFPPFTDFPLHFTNLSHPKIQLLSWFIWLSGIWTILMIIRKEKIQKIVRRIFLVFLFLSLLVIYGIFLPVQRYKLVPKSYDTVLIDLHSHTIYSHDGIGTPSYNLQWHKNYGFHCWAVTDHKNVYVGAILQEDIIKRNSLPVAVIPAQEIYLKGIYLNLLGIEKDVNPKEFDDLKELVDTVHSYGGAVIVPHIWSEKKSRISLEEIAAAGVDGFEIVGISSVPLTREKQRKIIELCRRKKKVMISGTNWHGWNNLCNVWTSFKVDNWNNLAPEERKEIVVEAIRKEEIDRFRVITYHYNYAPKNIIFTPFTWVYSYISSLDKVQRFFWIFWVVLLYLVFTLIKERRQVVMAIWFLISTLLFLKAIYLFELYLPIKEANDILSDVCKGLLIFSLITLFMGLSNTKYKH
ncbi:MAG: glycosyltransferase family 39 protein [Candidatus Omnitrophica bacterium]|nr:glycosyltransferase family 39 protein [Candidatus Omnitrophota bacterium]MCM8777330.1 glycosyltransferase family 39 protein [Candidatus Omnitrophota bacterium]